MKFHHSCIRPALAALLAADALIHPSPAAATAYNFQTLSHNGSRLEVWGISNNGTIVGQIATQEPNGNFDSFIMHGSSFEDVPPAGSDIISTFRSINDGGFGIVRDLGIVNNQLVDTSYLWTFNNYSLAYPASYRYVYMTEDFNQVGQTFAVNPNGDAAFESYRYAFPGATETEFDGATTVINNASTALGRYVQSDGTPQMFLIPFTDPNFGTPTPLQRPGSFKDIQPRVINNGGDIAGYYTVQAGGSHGFIRTVDGSYTTIDYPGGTDTNINGMNDSGVIVGTYFDAANAYQGFMATPIYTYSMQDAQFALIFASGLGDARGLNEFTRSDIDRDGQITLRDAELILRRVTGVDPNS